MRPHILGNLLFLFVLAGCQTEPSRLTSCGYDARGIASAGQCSSVFDDDKTDLVNNKSLGGAQQSKPTRVASMMIEVYKRALIEGKDFSFLHSEIGGTLQWMSQNVSEFRGRLQAMKPDESVQANVQLAAWYGPIKREAREILPLIQRLESALVELSGRDKVKYDLYVDMARIYADLMALQNPETGGLSPEGIQPTADTNLFYDNIFDEALTKLLRGDRYNIRIITFTTKYRRNYYELLPYSMYFPTHENLGIKSFNDLSPYPIYPVVMSRTPQMADGVLRSPLRFYNHDMSHASLWAAGVGQLDPAKWGALIEARQKAYLQMDTKLAENTKLSDLDKRTIRLCWFYVTHERGVHTGLNQFYANKLEHGQRTTAVDDLVLRISDDDDLGMYFKGRDKPNHETLLRAFEWIRLNAGIF